MDGWMDSPVPYQELEQRRAKVAASRQPAKTEEAGHENDSEAMQLIHQILNPCLKLPKNMGPYKMPDEVTADDIDALKDLDVRKLAELKEVFSLFDTDCDGLISKEDLRFTFMALGGEAEDEVMEEMMKEAKDPLDYDAFVELMSRRTIELDPEDVLLEAWSKWDEWGTGKIDEKNCSDYIELFPYLRELVIENSTKPEYVICNSSSSSIRNNEAVHTHDVTHLAATDLFGDEFIYSAGKIFGIRMRFKNAAGRSEAESLLNLTVEYRFLKKENFRTNGRLLKGSYCDYYFFAHADNSPIAADIWQYFHSPRFPAKYPAHIKCAYKFIGRPNNVVEIVFEELHLPKQTDSCNMDTLTIFDAESAYMNDVIDVICWHHITKRVVSSGPDLLIEFNASSNITAKGFRGRFRFVKQIQQTDNKPLNISKDNNTTKTIKSQLANSSTRLKNWEYYFEVTDDCHQIFYSHVNKSGKFETTRVLAYGGATSAVIAGNSKTRKSAHHLLTNDSIECRFEFYGNTEERVQIRFLDFNLPTAHKNSSECKLVNSLQLLKQVRGKYAIDELFCGAFLPKPIMSAQSELVLQFVGHLPKPNERYRFYGFKAEFRFLTNFGINSGQQVDKGCNFMYNSTQRKSGYFTSPNFPGLYPQNLTCNYFFYGVINEQIHITFTYFDVEGIGNCDYLTASDYVELSNFLTTDRKFTRYCGKRVDKFQVRSDGHFFRVTFYSNDRFDNIGFRALYEFETAKTIIRNVSEHSYLHSYASSLFPVEAWPIIIFSTVLIILL